MTLKPLPTSFEEAQAWTWENYEPHVQALLDTEVSKDNIQQWLDAWSQLQVIMGDIMTRLTVRSWGDTENQDCQAALDTFRREVFSQWQATEAKLRQQWVDSQLVLKGVEVAFDKIRSQLDIFTEKNIELLAEEQSLIGDYHAIAGAQTAQWEGQEVTLDVLTALRMHPDRSRRESAFRLAAQRTLQDRERLTTLWLKLVTLRQQIAANAGVEDYRAYKWKDLGRVDYQPQDVLNFCQAIEQVVVPALERYRERLRQSLGYDHLHPWDVALSFLEMSPDPLRRPDLRPFDSIEDYQAKAEAIFRKVKPEFGDYFSQMRREDLLDLGDRKGKQRIGMTYWYPWAKRPGILLNAVGSLFDILVLLHESGHAFHCFEFFKLPVMQQVPPIEFAEVASMSMQLLGMRYVNARDGGYFNDEETARYQLAQMENVLNWWPSVAMYVQFQHWVYTHPEPALDSAQTDAKFSELWHRYNPGVDFSGFTDWVASGWQRLMHPFAFPFYMIEYGIAQLGAVQIWANSLKDYPQTVEQYHVALKLGNSVSLPQLYAAAGAKFALDAGTLKSAVDLIEDHIQAIFRDYGLNSPD